MNLALFEVSTRGGVNQPLARPGVRAHRDPGALGGHRCGICHAIRDLSGLCLRFKARGTCVMRWEGGIAEEDHFSSP